MIPAWCWTLDRWDAEDDQPIEVRAVICSIVNGYLHDHLEQGEPEEEVTKLSRMMWVRYQLTGCP